MSDLMSGSKGSDVKALQKAMNGLGTLGVKLKEDGVFGERTEAALKKWQKLQGEKSTGRIAKSALKAVRQSGGKVPVMTVRDYAPRITKNVDSVRNNGAEVASQAEELDEARKRLRKRIDDSHAIEKKMTKASAQNKAYLADWLGDAKKIAAMQTRFEAVAQSDPAGAAKLVKEIEALDAQAERTIAKMRANVDLLRAEWHKLQPILEAAA
ncbi:MAG: peptidoglycan-binding domain-containing protein [Pseudomonadota bacterium]